VPSKEALIALAALGVIWLLALCAWEHLSPSHSRRPRPRVAGTGGRHGRRSSRPRHAIGAHRTHRADRVTAYRPKLATADGDAALTRAPANAPAAALVDEIGQLTGQAIRSVYLARDCEALTALGRAQQLLATATEGRLPRQHREEVDRRLWWGYRKLGLRRLDAGEYDAAIEPLTTALRFADGRPERVAETQAALERAYEGLSAEQARTAASGAAHGEANAGGG